MVFEAGLVLLFVTDLLAVIAVYLIISLSLNLEFGFTGIPNFGKVLAVAGGAFVAGSIPGRILAEIYNLPRGIQAFGHNEVLAECVKGLAFGKPKVLESMEYIADNVVITTCVNRVIASEPFLSIAILLLTVMIASLVGAALGFISSYPAIRLREDYLAITLLAMGEAMWTIGYYTGPIVGGTLGVSMPDPFRWAGGHRFLLAVMVLLLVASLTFVYSHMVDRSPMGRAMRAIREHELAAEVLGKNAVRIKQKILMISSVMASIAGALWAFYAGGVIAVGYDRVTWTFWPWVMVIVGGTGNNVGVLLGTVTFMSARKIIDFYKYALEPLLPFSVIWVDRLIFGVVLLLILILRSEGILGEKPRFTMDRKKLQEIANKYRG